MKNKIKKGFTSLAISMSYVLLNAQAFATTDVSVSGMSDELNKTIGEIISVLFWVACVVCTIKAIHIGILYMLTGVEGKSKAKGALLPWVIGIAICMTFATLGPAIMNLFYEPGKCVLSY